MIDIIDIDGIQDNGKIYGGNTDRYGITYNGEDYIIKLSKYKDDMSMFSEYLASNLIRALGVDCHEVFLARLNGQYVSMIKDFVSGTGCSLHSFKDTKQSSEDTDMTYKEYTYDDVIYLIDKHLKMSDEDKLYAKIAFWNMFICDAIIGNRDRHWGNWGYMWNGSSYKFSKLYDNGGGLFPDVYKVISSYENEDTRREFIK